MWLTELSVTPLIPKTCLRAYLNRVQLSTEMPAQPISSRYRSSSCLCQGILCLSCTLPAPQPQHVLHSQQNSLQEARGTLIQDREHKGRGRETPVTSLRSSVQGWRKRMTTRHLQKILLSTSASHSRFFSFCLPHRWQFTWDAQIFPLTFPWGSDGFSQRLVELIK